MSSVLSKLEIFDKNFNLKDYAAFDLSQFDINFDMLTLASNSVTLSKTLDVESGDYIYCTQGLQGIVDNVDYQDGQTTITFLPLLSYFDVSIFMAIYSFKPVTDNGEKISMLEAFEKIININFGSSQTDVSQQIKGLNIEVDKNNGDIENAALYIVSNINNFYEIIKKAFSKYRFICDFDLQPYDKKIVLTLKLSNTSVQINAEQPFVVSQEIFIKPSNNGINKFIAYWDGHLGEDGSILTYKKDQNQEYSKVTTESIQADEYIDFVEAAANRAYELFNTDELSSVEVDISNYITVTVIDGGGLYQDLQVGDYGTIYYKNKTYKAVLTAITKGNGVIKYTFGNIRIDLTDILILGGYNKL